jgi:uncharacterized membrane protein YqaE (UPF0057 family)
MRTNSLFSIVSFTIATLLLGSCATSSFNSGSILTKRKHNKGFHLSLNSGSKKSEVKEQTKISEIYSEEIAFNESLSYNNESTTSISNEAEVDLNDVKVTHANAVKESNLPQKSKVSNSSPNNSEIAITEFNETAADSFVKKVDLQKNEQKQNNNDVAFILILILCFLLPPLAVFLHRGGIDNMFWISLILTLLFWVPGIIFALWVVLVS